MTRINADFLLRIFIIICENPCYLRYLRSFQKIKPLKGVNYSAKKLSLHLGKRKESLWQKKLWKRL